MPAPTIVGTPTTANASGTTAVVLAKPTVGVTVQNDDLLVIAWREQSSGFNPALATLNGFTKLGAAVPNPVSTTVRWQGFWAKRVTDAGTEPASWTFNTGGSGRRVLAMFVVRGVDHEAAANASTYDGTLVTNGRATTSYALDTVPRLSLVLAGNEVSAAPYAPVTTPAGWTEFGVFTNTSGATRTVAWVGQREYTVSPVAAASTVWATNSGSSAQAVSLPGLADVPDPVGIPVTLGDGTTAALSVIVGGERVAPVSVRGLRPGFANVDQLLATPGATWAHRGGSANFPHMSEYAYDQAALTGYGCLEFSTQRTSDGVWFGIHDNNFDSTSETTGTPAPSTLTWAQVQATYENTLNDGGRPRPYWRLDEFLEKWAPTHVVVVDPKNGHTFRSEFLDVLDAHAGPDKAIVKYYGNAVGEGSNLPALSAARGYQTWGYFYEIDFTNGDLAAEQGPWSILGMAHGASQAAWDAVTSYGKPVVGHIANTQADYASAIAKGADMVQCANVLGIAPVSS